MDEAQEVKRQQRGEETREALLQAGVELLQEATLRDLLSSMSSRDVATRATIHWVLLPSLALGRG